MKRTLCALALMLASGVCLADTSVTVYVGGIAVPAEPGKTANITYVTCDGELNCSQPNMITVPILSTQVIKIPSPQDKIEITQVDVDNTTVFGPFTSNPFGGCTAGGTSYKGEPEETLTLEMNRANKVTCLDGFG